MKDGRTWIAGRKITIADFALAACYHSVVLNDNVKYENLKGEIYKTLTGYPYLKEWLKRISTDLRDYLDKRPKAVL